MVPQSRIQEQHQPISLQDPENQNISNIPTNPGKEKWLVIKQTDAGHIYHLCQAQTRK
jgi:hypothetical protein